MITIYANSRINNADSLVPSTYTNVGWLLTRWIMNGISRPTLKEGYYGLNVLTAQVPRITNVNAKKQASYVTYPFGTLWAIVENETYPFILRSEGTAITDPALTSRKVYVFVKEDPTGSLFHNGKVYKSLRQSQTFASVTGVDGAFITHYYGGDLLSDSEGNQFNFLFSGVQDPARPGGYGLITEDTSRRVAFRTDRSNNVVFYYGMLPPLAFDAFMSVSTPTGVMDLALYLTEKSNIKVVTTSGNIMTAGLTLPDAIDATKLRVMTASGIRAFQDALKTVGTGEPTQGEIDLSNEQGSDYEAPPPLVNISPTHNLNVTSSSDFSASYLRSNVYDGDENTLWYASGNVATLTTELKSPKVVKAVKILCKDDRAKTFYVDASHDNSTWTPLSTHVRLLNPTWQQFSINNTTAFYYYRLRFEGDVYSGSNVSISELELLG